VAKYCTFYAQELAIARISYGDSVLLACCLSRPSTYVPRPGEIETLGLHYTIA